MSDVVKITGDVGSRFTTVKPGQRGTINIVLSGNGADEVDAFVYPKEGAEGERLVPNHPLNIAMTAHGYISFGVTGEPEWNIDYSF